MKPICTLLSVFLFSALAACQSTQVNTVWKSPEPRTEPFKKVVAIVVNTTPAERRAAEDQLASQARTAQGIPAYTIIPDEDLKDREKVAGILKSHNIDGAFVLRLVSSDKTTTYHPSTYSTSSGLYGYRDYDLYSPPYTVTTVTVHAEISIYSVADEKLLWAGSSYTDDPSSIQELVRDVAKATVEELKKQGIVKQ